MDSLDLRKPILYGGINGLVLGLFMIFAIFLGDIVFESLIFVIIVFGLMISIPPIVLSNDEVSFGILIPISFLTFIIPVFGISFGLPNTEIFSLMSLVAISGIGGLFWGSIFSIAIYIYRKFKS